MPFESLTHLKKFVAFHYHVSKSLSSCQVFTEVLLIWLPCCIFFLYYPVIEFSVSGKKSWIFLMGEHTAAGCSEHQREKPIFSFYSSQNCSDSRAFFKGKMFI